MQNVAVIGASANPERYSYRAVEALKKNGHAPYPVSRNDKEILGLQTWSAISEIPDPIDTVTIYVGLRSWRPSLTTSSPHPLNG